MVHVAASINKIGFISHLLTDSGVSILADEPTSNGGENKGFSPHELLAASLASCTTITLRMYANRKQWALEELKVDVTIDKDIPNNISIFQCAITFPDNISEEQKTRLIQIANQCPIHKILSNSIQINTVSL